MRWLTTDLWRRWFLLAAVLIGIGGPQHPRGTMVEMLAEPAWFRAHALMLAGFVALAFGLVLRRRTLPAGHRLVPWLRAAIVATIVQAIEMALHTAAAVDQPHLAAGAPTPILTAHLALSVVAYPLFGLVLAGTIVVGGRDRALGAPWFGWIGVIGALAHGAAPPLVIVANLEGARLLFPLLLLFALWLALTALWPHPEPVAATAG